MHMGQPAAERKQVSVLFSDLSGFTAASERLDPEEMREVMARIFEQAASIVARHEGRIEKFIGDAVMAIFGVPVAHEDDALRAVRAALDLHDAVHRLNPDLEPRMGAPLAMHSGIASGIVVTGELTFDHGTAGPLGSTVNLAARLMSAAPDGQVWIASETRRLLGARAEVEDLGRMAFKGKAEPVAVARVTKVLHLGAGAASYDSRFVGREAELRVLSQAQRSSLTGSAQVVGIQGEPGCGKSRLFNEFRFRLGTDVIWLEGRAFAPSSDTPFAPVIDLLSRHWGIGEGDSPKQVRERIVDAVGRWAGVEDSAMVPIFLHLYRLDQAPGIVVERESFPQRLGAAVRSLLTALARRSPLVVAFQDLHWADQPTIHLLLRLCEDLSAPLLLLLNYRPGFEPWSSVAEIRLGELSPAQAGELVASLLGSEPPPPIARFIAERSDGNPFYVEELVRSLVETGVLERDDDGRSVVARTPETAGIPPTVRGVIAARIDRLESAHKAVLRDASVVGRAFQRSVIAEVTREPERLDSSLGQLSSADLVRLRSIGLESEYWFKHALTHEVAYESLLKTERQRLHGDVGRALERLLAGRIAEHVETLAYHFRLAGIVDKAVRYLIDAGKASVERYALAEAGRHFRHAHALLVQRTLGPATDRLLAELLVEWSHVHYYDGTIDEWHRLLERHRDDVRGCGDVALQALYMGWLGNVRLFRADPRGALEVIDDALDEADPAASDTVIAYLQAWRAHALMSLGRHSEAAAAAHKASSLQEAAHPTSYARIKADVSRSRVLAYQGDLAGARRIAQRLIELGTVSGNARASAQGHAAMNMHWMLVLDFERAVEAAEQGMKAARDPTFVAMNAMWATLSLVVDMRFDEARALCDRYVGFLLDGGNHWFGQSMVGARHVVDMARGDYSAGMRGGLATIEWARRQGWEESRFYGEVLLLQAYVSIVRREPPPRTGHLLANPWFVATQALFAAQHARRLLLRLRAEASSAGLHGFDGLLDLAEARLLAHQKRHAEAGLLLERMRVRLVGGGISHVPATLVRLESEIVARSR